MKNPPPITELNFGSVLRYYPVGRGSRGQQRFEGLSRAAQLSQDLMKAVKNCRNDVISSLTNTFSRGFVGTLVPVFVGSQTVLVPVPRSSPLKFANSAWPARWICEKIVKPVVAKRFQGTKIVPLLIRTQPVTPARTGKSAQRRVSDHYRTIAIDQDLLKRYFGNGSKRYTVVLVDDIITSGNTVMACAWRIKEDVPNVDIRAFAMFRTISSYESSQVEQLVEPVVGKVKYNPDTDWCSREP